MNDLLAILTTALIVIAVFALGPFPELAFIVQMGAVGTAVGTVLAVHRTHRNPGYPFSRLILRWTAVGRHPACSRNSGTR